MQLIYTQVAGKLKELILALPTIGVPAKVTQEYLAGLGYKSSNDRTMVPVLKALGIISSDGVPTDHWQGLRDRSNQGAYLAKLVQQAYPELYAIYPDAHNQPDSKIRDFLTSKSKSGERMIQLAVSTYRTLVSISNFFEEPFFVANVAEASLTSPITTIRKTTASRASSGPALTINIHIASDTSPTALEAIFKGLKDLTNEE